MKNENSSEHVLENLNINKKMVEITQVFNEYH